jgi:hypothetical protein
MKPKLYFLIIIFCIGFKLKAQEKYAINWDYKNLSFIEFVTKAEGKLGVKFFYRDEWVSGLKLPGNLSCNTLTCVLDSLFSKSSLYYYIDEDGNVVVTRNYAVRFSNAKPDKEIKNTQTGNNNTRENQQKEIIISMELGNRADRNTPGKATISGYVRDLDTKEAIAGATIFVQDLNAGTNTNSDGFYRLLLPRGSHLIRFSYMGMKEKKINLNLFGSGNVNIDLSKTSIALNEVLVSGEKNMTLQRFEVGAEKINVASFKLLPSSLGEPDILKSILMIPGVQSVGEGSAGFNVRGGSADQNLVLLSGAPVYNSSHFFGFFSAVNSDIIEGATLYKGGIPCRYGGRISSVLDITSKEGNKKEFAGKAGIGLITTDLMVEGPIIKDTLSYILTGRTTYSNWLFGIIDNPAVRNSRGTFYDFNGKVTYNINRKNKLDISSYFSHDSFRFYTKRVYSYDNSIFVLNWLHFFNSNFHSLLSINNSFYKYNILSLDIPAEEYVMAHKINSTELKADFDWSKGINDFNFGLDATRYEVMPGSFKPASDSSVIIQNIIANERALEGSLYVDDKISLTSFLSVNVGVRFSSFFAFGSKSVLLYDPGFSKTGATVTDTLNFRNGEISSRYGGPELRASLNFRISDNNSLKINYNRTRQYLHLLSNSTTISPTDSWKLCDYYHKPQTGDQYALGLYQMLFKNRIEASAELYYKEIKNMVDFKGGSTQTIVTNLEQYLINARGKAYGLELAIKKTEGKVRYSIGYTYSRTFIKSTSKFREEVINAGKWYPANFDKPNDLVITFQYFYSRRFSFTSNYTWSTGRPVTYPLSSYTAGNTFLIQYSDRNKYRIPDYSRLDISCRISGNLRSHAIAHPNWTFSVYNILGNENAYSVYFIKKGTTIKGYKLSVFGRAFPSVTFSFDF